MLKKSRLRLRALFFKPKMEDELQAELQFHLEREIEENIARGMTPEDARYAAIRSFGGVERVKEESRDVRGIRLLEEIWQDMRFGLRMLQKNPGFTLIAIITLALGIGANTAIFSVVNAALLRPLPYDNPDRIMSVSVMQPQKGVYQLPFALPNYLDLRERAQSFTEIAAYRGWQYTITGAGEPVTVFGERVTANLFPVLGVQPMIGRYFLPEEDATGNDSAVILSYGLWQSRFGGDRNIINSPIMIDDAPRTVVGVMPPGFYFSTKSVELWVPLSPTKRDLNRALGNMRVIARLKPGINLKQAQAEVKTIAAQLEQQYPENNKDQGIQVATLQEDIVGNIKPALLMLLGAVTFVLLIACGNVANLQLAQAIARQKDIAIGMAMGATRGRLVRQLLTESIALSVIGGLLALLLAHFGAKLLVRLSTDRMPRVSETAIDFNVLFFTLLLAVGVGILFGLVPALQATKPDVSSLIKEGGASMMGLGRGRIRNVLVIAEVALAIILMVGAGLMIKSFNRLTQVNVGFNTKNILTMGVFLSPARYKEPEKQAAYYQQVLQRIEATPGVKSAGANIGLPFSGAGIYISFVMAGRPDVRLGANYRAISPNYFKTMGIPVLRGREFEERDNDKSAAVAVVNHSFAERFFPGEDPIGKVIDISDGYNILRQIVGVVGDVKSKNLTAEVAPEMYVVNLQRPWQWTSFAVSTYSDPHNLTPAIRNAVWGVDKDVPVNDVKTLDEMIGQTVAEPKFYTIMLAIFAGVALILATVGVYGVVSYSVSQRTREIGIRMALGAPRHTVIKMVFQQSLALALIGAVLGLIGAYLLTRVLSTLLYAVSTTDAMTFLLIPLGLAIVVLIATYIPARRASLVDPLTALRNQ
jgi:putative ABC transport system permease protein